MGYDHSAYLAYGVRIPLDPYDRDDEYRAASDLVDEALSVPTVKDMCPDVSHLEAGKYDEHMFFLVAHSKSAELGKYEQLDQFPAQQLSDWNRQLAHALITLGWHRMYPDLEPPGWFVVASMD